MFVSSVALCVFVFVFLVCVVCVPVSVACCLCCLFSVLLVSDPLFVGWLLVGGSCPVMSVVSSVLYVVCLPLCLLFVCVVSFVCY